MIHKNKHSQIRNTDPHKYNKFVIIKWWKSVKKYYENDEGEYLRSI